MESNNVPVTPTKSSDVEINNIELEHLDDIVVATPSDRLQAFDHTQYGHHDDSDDEENHDGNAALLGPRHAGYKQSLRQSTWLQIKYIVLESSPTLLMSTIGLLFTGELLNSVSRSKAMLIVNELLMIIPVILNLKGNLEMNLSARLSTAANMGQLDDPKTRHKIIFGNLALLQSQAAVVSLVAACVSMMLGILVPALSTPDIDDALSRNANDTISFFRRSHSPLVSQTIKGNSALPEFIMVASTSMLSACISSTILGCFMSGLIIICRRFNLDPDNIAPPIASCLGDLVTLFLLGILSSAMINVMNTSIPLLLGILPIVSAIICTVIVRRNDAVKHLILEGWSPLFGAMAFSTAAGIVLDLFASRYEGFPLLAMMVSGLPGSVGSILVSRLSTALHAAQFQLPSVEEKPKEIPLHFIMLTLLVVTIPIDILFLIVVWIFGWLELPIVFSVFSVVFFCAAVIFSLYLAKVITPFLWSRNLDPDTYALPMHSAMMDLVGQLLLVACYEIVSLMGTTVEAPS